MVQVSTNSVAQPGYLVDPATGEPIADGGIGLTDTELRATPVPVSVSGGATAANQATQITAEQAILAAVDTLEALTAAMSAKLPATLGAKTSPNSLSVVNSYLTCAAGGDGSVNTAETITVASTVQLVEFFNLSANVIWASWVGTAAADTTGSFPIPALASGVAGFYSAPPGASGSLSIIAVGGASAFTCNLWS